MVRHREEILSVLRANKAFLQSRYPISELGNDLEDLLGAKIDLVHKRAIRPKYWPYIQKNLIYV